MEPLVRTLEYVSAQTTQHRASIMARPQDTGHRAGRGIALATLQLVSDRLLEEIQREIGKVDRLHYTDPRRLHREQRMEEWNPRIVNAETAINLRGTDEETDAAVEAVMKQHGLNQVKLYGDPQ